MTDRNIKGIFFKISGYLPHEVDEMIYRQKAVKEVLKDQRERKTAERRLIRNAKHNKGSATLDAIIKVRKIMLQGKKKAKPERLEEQIQYGWDLAAKWKKEWEEQKIKNGDFDIETRIVGINDSNSEAYTDCKTYIALNVEKMLTQCFLLNMTFEHYFCQCISHEYIHCLLNELVSWGACDDFDNICILKDIRETGKFAPETWHGGIPWRTKDVE